MTNTFDRLPQILWEAARGKLPDDVLDQMADDKDAPRAAPDLAALQAENARLTAQNDAIEAQLSARRKLHKTDSFLLRTADARAHLSGPRPVDAMAVSDLEEAYTDCRAENARLREALAYIAKTWPDSFPGSSARAALGAEKPTP